MKQVVARAEEVEVIEVPTLVCPVNGVLVKTEWSVISTGTESWAIGSTEPIGASDVMKHSSLMNKAYRLSRDVVRQEGVSGLRDYIEASLYGERPETIRLPKADEGHSNELREIGNLLKGKDSRIITTPEVFAATELTLRVDEAVRGTALS